MKTSYISTATLWNSPRVGAARLEAEIAKANVEMDNDGRFADVGLELGYRTGTTIDLRQAVDELTAQKGRNNLTRLRVDNTDSALTQIRTDGESFLALVASGKLIGSQGSEAVTEATSRLSALIGELNATVAGQFIFSGINTEKPPIADTQSVPPAAAKAAFQAAFRTAFGFDPGTEPGADTITAAQMQDFLDGPVANLFTGSQWTATWSSASSVNIHSELAGGETAETSVNANAQPIRQLAMLYTIGSQIGLTSLGPEAQAAVYSTMRALASQATFGMTGIQSNLGIVQSRIQSSDNALDARIKSLKLGYTNLESIDLAELKTRQGNLEAELQISYNLTSEMRKFNLIDYV